MVKSGLDKDGFYIEVKLMYVCIYIYFKYHVITNIVRHSRQYVIIDFS